MLRAGTGTRRSTYFDSALYLLLTAQAGMMHFRPGNLRTRKETQPTCLGHAVESSLAVTNLKYLPFASNHIQRITMDEPPQNLYAKNLRQPFGYPLRSPEPKPGLPSSYEEHGLHIGDVGYVDEFGMFEVQFNICFPLHHELHQARRNDLTKLVGLAEFTLNDAPLIPDSIPSGSVICHGIQGSHGDHLSHSTQRYIVYIEYVEMRHNADSESIS